jgi:hypothetical protein
MRLAEVGRAVAISRTPMGRKNLAMEVFIDAVVGVTEKIAQAKNPTGFSYSPSFTDGGVFFGLSSKSAFRSQSPNHEKAFCLVKRQ